MRINNIADEDFFYETLAEKDLIVDVSLNRKVQWHVFLWNNFVTTWFTLIDMIL